MKKTLLLLTCLMGVGYAHAQGTWTDASSSWVYNLGNNTSTFPAGHVYTYGDATLNGTTYSSSESKGGASPVPGFLPTPPSGTSKALAINAGGGDLVINNPTNPATASVTMSAAAASGNTKFSTYGIDNASEIASMFFTVSFNTVPTNGTITWAIGRPGAGSSLFSNSSAVFRANAETFTSLQWAISAGGIDFSFRESAPEGSGNAVNQTLSTTAFVKGTPAEVEVYANNSTASKTYTRSSTTYTVGAGKFHVWVDGVQLTYSGNADIPKSLNSTDNVPELADNEPLNSYLFHAGKSTTPSNNAAQVTMSKIQLDYHTSTLPVSLKSFSGKKKDNAVQLSWSTASEQNNAYFEVLRAADGKNFTSIATISGNGTSTSLHNYSYTDANPVSGTNYYQLKQVDMNGKFTVYDQVLAIKTDMGEQNGFSVHVVNGNDLQAEIYTEKAGKANFRIANLSGMQVFNSALQLQKGHNTITLHTSGIAPGMYVASFIQDGKRESVKLLK